MAVFQPFHSMPKASEETEVAATEEPKKVKKVAKKTATKKEATKKTATKKTATKKTATKKTATKKVETKKTATKKVVKVTKKSTTKTAAKKTVKEGDVKTRTPTFSKYELYIAEAMKVTATEEKPYVSYLKIKQYLLDYMESARPGIIPKMTKKTIAGLIEKKLIKAKKESYTFTTKGNEVLAPTKIPKREKINKPIKEEKPITVDESLGIQRDLRKLTVAELRERLMAFGVEEAKISLMYRWEQVDMLRQLMRQEKNDDPKKE